MNVEKGLDTPAFVIDEQYLDTTAQKCSSLAKEAGCQLLYSPKALAHPFVLNKLAAIVDGFSCSSVNEAKLSRAAIHKSGSVHLVTPGISRSQLPEISEHCDYVVLNSLTHWELYSRALRPRASLGLRVNPGLSFVDDSRYDPCRRYSKLGVSLDALCKFFENPRAECPEGLHFHNNCDSTCANELFLTLDRLSKRLGREFKKLRWLNIGGGYLLNELSDPEMLLEAVSKLRREFDIEIFAEPGAALVRGAGSIHSTVIDMFESDGASIAVLDTTVNHMPEVLEYEFTPEIEGATEHGEYAYYLAGCTCLAGDQFGEVKFSKPLSIGSVITFPNSGAYTLSRANTFNGVSLPNVYRRSPSGKLRLMDHGPMSSGLHETAVF